jgi:hypothetical protein
MNVLISFVTSVNFPIISNVEVKAGTVVLKNPYVISTEKNEKGDVVVKLFKFPPLASPAVDSVEVLSTSLILSYEPSSDVLNEYIRLITTGQTSEQTPEQNQQTT